MWTSGAMDDVMTTSIHFFVKGYALFVDQYSLFVDLYPLFVEQYPLFLEQLNSPYCSSDLMHELLSFSTFLADIILYLLTSCPILIVEIFIVQ
jgi:hypothetical protein